MNSFPDSDWTFPFCPAPPEWYLDWSAIFDHFEWVRQMEGIPQDSEFHAEGDVCVHTRMVARSLTNLKEWQEKSGTERAILFAAALLHDTGKVVCTKKDPDGRIS